MKNYLSRKNNKYNMDIFELFEARNWQNIDDPTDSWLAKFTYENINKYPSNNILKILMKRYPFDGGKLYRGMNFRTEEDWNSFSQSIKNGVMITNGVTSWSVDETTVHQFAQTRPSYNLDAITMRLYGEAEAKGEEINGYCGIILETIVGPDAGIDVNKSNLGHESEVILIPGTYNVKVNRLKKFEEMMDDNMDINRVILSSTKEDFYSNNKNFKKYILMHYGKQLSKSAQTHLFNMYYPKNQDEVFEYEFTKRPFEYNYVPDEGMLYIYFPRKIFSLYEDGIIRDPELISKLKVLANKIVSKALPIIEKYLPISENNGDSKVVYYLAKLCGKENAYTSIFAKYYKKLEVEGRALNNIKDPEEKKKAMRVHVEKIKRLMQML
jgi:hypothetical protein